MCLFASSKSAYFNSADTKYNLICINTDSGNHLSTTTEANIYSLACLSFCGYSQSVEKKNENVSLLGALQTPVHSVSVTLCLGILYFILHFKQCFVFYISTARQASFDKNTSSSFSFLRV